MPNAWWPSGTGFGQWAQGAPDIRRSTEETRAGVCAAHSCDLPCPTCGGMTTVTVRVNRLVWKRIKSESERLDTTVAVILAAAMDALEEKG